MLSSTHSSTTFLKRSKDMTPCLRCISSRGQNTHFALHMFVLSSCTISGRIGARSRPVASRRRRTGLAFRRSADSSTVRARALIFRGSGILLLAVVLDDAFEHLVELY